MGGGKIGLLSDPPLGAPFGGPILMLECEMAGPRGLGPWPSGLGALSASALGLGCWGPSAPRPWALAAEGPFSASALGLGDWGPSAPRPWALVTGGDSKGEIFKDDASRGLGMVSFADLPSGASRETLFL